QRQQLRRRRCNGILLRFCHARHGTANLWRRSPSHRALIHMRKPIGWAAICVLIACSSDLARASVAVSVISDTTWRATNPLPATGWNTDIVFDDSDAA